MRINASERKGSGREDLSEKCQRGLQCTWLDDTEMLLQATLINRPNLIEQHETLLVGKLRLDAEICRLAPGCQRHDDNSAEVVVHIIGRHDKNGTRFLNLRPNGGVERREPDLASGYHTQSVSSSSLGKSPRTSSSSPAAAMRAASSAQPWRTGFRKGSMTTRPSMTRRSSRSPISAPIS